MSGWRNSIQALSSKTSKFLHSQKWVLSSRREGVRSAVTFAFCKQAQRLNFQEYTYANYLIYMCSFLNFSGSNCFLSLSLICFKFLFSGLCGTMPKRYPFTAEL